MKKVILTILIIIYAVTLIGCGDSGDSSTSSKSDNLNDSSQKVTENKEKDINIDNKNIEVNDNSDIDQPDDSCNNENSNETEDSNTYSIYSYFSDDAIEIVNNIDDKVKVHTRNGRVLKELDLFFVKDDRSLYHDVVVIQISDSIHIINNEKEIEIEQACYAAISDNGETVLYESVDTDKNRFLQAYDLVTGETKTIDNVSDGHFYNLNFSPDGKSIAYNIKRDDKSFEAFLSINGNQPISLGEGNTLVAISNEGKLVYYLDEANSFYVKSDKETTFLSSSSIKISFNKDYTQVMFSRDDTNLCINGEEPIKLMESGEESTYIIDPEASIYRFKDNCTVYGIDSFADKYFVIHYDNTLKDICYIDENYTATKVLSEITEYSISDSNEALVKSSDCIYRVEKTDYEKVLDIPCRNIYASNQASNFYYVTENDELYYKKGKEEPSLIASNIMRYELQSYKNVLYYITRDEFGRTLLHYTINGEPGKIVKNGEGISMLDCSGGLRFYKYKADGYCDVYTNISVDELVLMIENFI